MVPCIGAGVPPPPPPGPPPAAPGAYGCRAPARSPAPPSGRPARARGRRRRAPPPRGSRARRIRPPVSRPASPPPGGPPAPVLGNSFSGGSGLPGAARPGGAHAELVVARADRVVHKPAEVTHDDAAGVLFGGTTARWFLHDKAGVAPGSTVLVNGASGAVGTNAVQLARLAGATVTGVTSGPNEALVSHLGASRVIDHTDVDLGDLSERFDVVFDTVGNLSRASGRRLLNPGGVLVLAVAGLGDTLRARGPVVAGPAPERAADSEVLLGLVAGGDLTVVVDEVFELDRIVDAHRRVDTGHKVGNVILRPGA